MNPDCIDWLRSFYGQEWWLCSHFHGLCSWLRCCKLHSYFPIFFPIIITGRHHTPTARGAHMHAYTKAHFLVTLHTLQKSQNQKPATDVGRCSSQLKENCNRNSVAGRLSPAGFLMPFQWSACSCSANHDIWVSSFSVPRESHCHWIPK